MISEELSVNTGPDKSAVGIDVNFANTNLGGWEILFRVNAFGAFLELTASSIDAGDFFLRNGR